MEIWKAVKGYEQYYEVSSMGRVKGKSYKGERILKPFTTKNGYLNVVLCVKQKRIHKNIHRLVAENFIDNPDNLDTVNHKDCNKKNNNVENLEWCTIEYNNIHAMNNNRLQKYEDRPQSKLKKEQVILIPEYIKMGATTNDLSVFFNVSRRAIDNIFEGKNWKGLGIDFTEIKPNKEVKNKKSWFWENIVLPQIIVGV